MRQIQCRASTGRNLRGASRQAVPYGTASISAPTRRERGWHFSSGPYSATRGNHSGASLSQGRSTAAPPETRASRSLRFIVSIVRA